MLCNFYMVNCIMHAIFFYIDYVTRFSNNLIPLVLHGQDLEVMSATSGKL